MPRDDWQPKRRLEKGYFNSLNQIMQYLVDLIKDEDNPFTIVKLLKFAFNNPVFKRHAYETAKRMVTMLFVSNPTSWRHAARKSSKGKIIYKALINELKDPVIGGAFNDQVQRNAGIIQTLPLNISEKVTDYIAKESLKGRRASDIAKEIQLMFPGNTRAKATLIARTEVSKTTTALTRSRAENLGMMWYEWRTSEDERVRKSHDHMHSALINWNNPANPEKLIGESKPNNSYHAGEIYNCRCYPAPLTDIDDVSWPHKVFIGGKIITMSKAKFQKIM